MFVLKKLRSLFASRNLEESIRTKIYPNARSIQTSCSRACVEENITKFTHLEQKIGYIGDGNMAKAIATAIIKQDLIKPSQVYVSSPYKKNLGTWKSLGAHVSLDNGYVASEADVIFLAVKPHVLPDAVEIIKKSPHAASVPIKNKLFVSILAGVKISKVEDMLSSFEGSRVIRLMPNTPMLIAAGCTAYCVGKGVTDLDISVVRAILEATGICQRVPEHMMDAVGALSGAGPAFIYMVIEALSDGGVRMGLHRDLATRFAAQTVLGAAKMVLETGKHTGQLKDEVASAGGITIKGLHQLEKSAVRGAFMNAVEQAAKKSIKLGKSSF